MPTDGVETITATSDAMPMDEFIRVGNALDRGEEVAAAPAIAEPTAIEREPVVDDEADVNDAPQRQPEPPKIDKRTREGRKASIQQEIDDLTTQRHDITRELEHTRAELARLRAERESVAQPAPQPAALATPVRPDGAAPSDPEPSLDQFKNEPDPYTAYMRAVSRWETRQEAAKMLAQNNARFAQAAEAQQWQQRIADAKTRIENFDTRIKPDTPIDARVMPFVQRHALGPDVLVYLSEHQDEARALLSLHPVEQIGRIGEIIGTLKSKTAVAPKTGPTPPPQPISAAKPPPKPVGASPVVSADAEDDASLPVEEYIRRANTRDKIVVPRIVRR